MGPATRARSLASCLCACLAGALAPSTASAQYDVRELPVVAGPEWSEVYAHHMALDGDLLVVDTLTQLAVFHRGMDGAWTQIQTISPADVRANGLWYPRLTASELVVGVDSAGRYLYFARTGAGAETRFVEHARIALPESVFPGQAVDIRGDRMILSDAYWGPDRDGRAYVFRLGGSGTCGDAVCRLGETCPADCDPRATCGNGRCDPSSESCSCPEDCGERACWTADDYASGLGLTCPRTDSDTQNWCGWRALFTADDEIVLGANRRLVTRHVRTGLGWERRDRFGLSGSTPTARFGIDMDFDDPALAIGGSKEAGGGVVQIHERDALGNWSVASVVRPPFPSDRGTDFFGYEVELDGDHLAVASGEADTRVLVYERHGTSWDLVSVLDNPAGYEEFTTGTLALDWPRLIVAWTEREPHLAPSSLALREYTFLCDGDCPVVTPPDAGLDSAALDGGAASPDAGSDGGGLDAGLDAMDGGDGADTDLVDRVVLACRARPLRTSAGHAWSLAAVALLAAWRRRARRVA